MIFVTIGEQLPFDRLIRFVDNWARCTGRTDVVAQIGASDYEPANLSAVDFLKPEEFTHHMREASAIVSHAGMGTVISALELGKPILVLPRLARFREHRSDHQLDTAKRLNQLSLASVCYSEEDLAIHLNGLRDGECQAHTSTTLHSLIDRVRDYAFS